MKVPRLSTRAHLRAIDAALALFVLFLAAWLLALEWVAGVLLALLFVAAVVSVWP